MNFIENIEGFAISIPFVRPMLACMEISQANRLEAANVAALGVRHLRVTDQPEEESPVLTIHTVTDPNSAVKFHFPGRLCIESYGKVVDHEKNHSLYGALRLLFMEVGNLTIVMLGGLSRPPRSTGRVTTV